MMLIYVFIQKASVGKKSQFQTPPHSPEKAEKKKKSLKVYLMMLPSLVASCPQIEK